MYGMATMMRPSSVRTSAGTSSSGTSPVQRMPSSSRKPKVFSVRRWPGPTQPVGRLPVTFSMISSVSWMWRCCSASVNSSMWASLFQPCATTSWRRRCTSWSASGHFLAARPLVENVPLPPLRSRMSSARHTPARPPNSPKASDAGSNRLWAEAYCEWWTNASKATLKVQAIFASSGQRYWRGLSATRDSLVSTYGRGRPRGGVGDPAAGHRQVDRQIAKVLRRHVARVLAQHGQVGQLAALDRAELPLDEARVRRVDRLGAQRLLERQRLVRGDDRPAEGLVRHGRAD